MKLRRLLIQAQANMGECKYMSQTERDEINELIDNLKRATKEIDNSERRINDLMNEVIELKKKLNEELK